jgi:hypothetical protein
MFICAGKGTFADAADPWTRSMKDLTPYALLTRADMGFVLKWHFQREPLIRHRLGQNSQIDLAGLRLQSKKN